MYQSLDITDSSRSSASRGKVECWRGTEDDCRQCEYLLRRTDGRTDCRLRKGEHSQSDSNYIYSNLIGAVDINVTGAPVNR